MIKLMHTADVHLDSPFSGAGLTAEQARQRRSDILYTFEAICKAVKDHAVDLFLIAGDLFDEEYLTPATLKTVLDLLAGLESVPVLISPGNHDPYHASSPYRIETWPANVHIFTSLEPEKIHFDNLDLTVHGCGFTGPHVTRDIWNRFRVEHTRANATNVILTHGAVYENEPGQAKNYLPIRREDLLATGADYVALGHYHRGFSVIEDKFAKSTRAAYPGCPEPMRWGAVDDHGPLLVSIDQDKNSVSTERLVLSQRRYHEMKINAAKHVTSRDYQLAISELVEEAKLTEKDMVRITIEGRHDPRIPVEIDAILPESSPVFAIEIVNKALPDFDVDNICKERSVRGLAVKSLVEKTKSENQEERQIAEQALYLVLTAFEGLNPEDVPL